MDPGLDLKGKTVIVTGATGGIGKEIARGLAQRGATVILAARDRETGPAAANEIATDTGNASVIAEQVDVADVRSIRAFAQRIELDRLDILVNNAGAWFTERRT